MTFSLVTPTLISWITGWLILKRLSPGPNPWGGLYEAVVALGLGLAASSMITFSSFIFFNHWAPLYVLSIHGAAVFILGVIASRFDGAAVLKNGFRASATEWAFLAILAVASIPLWYQIFFYAYGGWDAWATWNLKAKFLFLGGENWQNMFHPKLWRSSPHYPLFLPLANVWTWALQSDPVYQGPALNAFIFTFLTTALLALSLYHLTRSRAAIWPALALLTMPFYNKLALSQYADNVVAFYLLLSCVLWLKSVYEESPLEMGLCGFFLGTMVFVKNEGLLLASLSAVLISALLWSNKKIRPKKNYVLAFLGGGITGVIPAAGFYWLYAPDNITFVNGLMSAAQPSTWLRFKTIMGFYSLEFFSPLWNIIALFHPSFVAGSYICKWNGIWTLLLIGILLSKGRGFQRSLWVIPLLITGFMTVITAYYWVNTYFQIEWWMQVSLNRIISGFLPLLIFWVFLSLWDTDSGT
jgi:hypothetical protein